MNSYVVLFPCLANSFAAVTHLTEEQKATAQELTKDMNASGIWPGPIVTEVAPASDFWDAEEEHQAYLQKHPYCYTCHYLRPDWQLPQMNKA